MYKDIKKLFRLCVCYFVLWALIIMFIVVPCTIIALGIAHADPSSTSLVSELFANHAHQDAMVRIAIFARDVSLLSFLYFFAILLGTSPLLLFAPLLNSLLIIRSIEQRKSFRKIALKTVRISTYIIATEAIIWYFIKKPFLGSIWAILVAEFIVLSLLSLCLNVLFYRYLIANRVGIRLQPIIKYLTTLQR